MEASDQALRIVKRILKWLLALLFPTLLLFISASMFIVILFAGNGEIVGLDNVNICSVSSVNDESLPNQSLLQYFKIELYTPQWSVIAYSLVEYGMDQNEVITTLNELSNYIAEKEVTLHETVVLQYIVYGKDYIDYVISNQKYQMRVSDNEEYSKEKNIANQEDDFFLKVINSFNNNCIIISDGFPIDVSKTDYYISGWYPNYNKDGTGDTHAGIDLAIPLYTPIYAVEAGEVLRVHNGEVNNNIIEKVGLYGAGNVVVIKSSTNVYLYGHLSTGDVRVGSKVEKGEMIGTSGSSGMSTGPHLHIEITPYSADWENNWGSINRTHNPCKVILNLCNE